MMLDKAEVEAEQGPFYFQVWHMFSVAELALLSSETASMLELHHLLDQRARLQSHSCKFPGSHSQQSD